MGHNQCAPSRRALRDELGWWCLALQPQRSRPQNSCSISRQYKNARNDACFTIGRPCRFTTGAAEALIIGSGFVHRALYGGHLWARPSEECGRLGGSLGGATGFVDSA